MDGGAIITLILLYSAGLLAGWGIILFLLWIRPEYMFLLFYVVANHILVFLFNVPQLTWADAPDYALRHAIVAAIEIAIGVPIVALFKWMKTRKSGRERDAEREIERIRADIAARDG
ncbi:MAG: hypothetical protein IPG56_04280 [Caulobacteraceae bacterium]|nr:hypothetical protein [Caulobacteraceae bacterium]